MSKAKELAYFRNQGRFHMSAEMAHRNYENLIEVFFRLGFLPVEAKYNPMHDAYEYAGFSPMFRETAMGEIPPEYIINISCDGDGLIKDVWVEEVTKDSIHLEQFNEVKHESDS